MKKQESLRMPARHARTDSFQHGIISKWARPAKTEWHHRRHHGIACRFTSKTAFRICCPVAASHNATGILHSLRQVFLCLCKSRNDMRENEILSYFLVQAHFLERGANMRVHA